MEILFDLQLFGEGDGGGSDGGAAAQGAEAGLQTDNGAADEAQARTDEFEAYISEHKDLYEAKLKQQLDRRMKGATRDIDALKGQNARYDALAQAIAQRYGKDANDLAALEQAVREDESWIEEQAARNGLTKEQQKHWNAIEAENARFKAAREEAERMAQRDATLQRWQAEADQLKQIYHEFDLDEEVNNPEFASLVGKGVAMQTAYEVVHKDELLTNAISYANNRAKTAIAASVRANGMRPTEGAGGNSAPSSMKLDVEKMTKEQRQEVIRRVMSGERITL